MRKTANSYYNSKSQQVSNQVFFQYCSTSNIAFNNLTRSLFSKTLYLDHPNKMEISPKTFRKKKGSKTKCLEPIQIVHIHSNRTGIFRVKFVN